VRALLHLGAALSFVVAVLGFTFEALAIVVILYLCERAEARR
jgi:hypothetical protein